MILKTLAAFIAVVLVLIGIVWMQLRAPTPVGVPLQHGVVANVTIVEPGHTPRDRQTLIVRDGVSSRKSAMRWPKSCRDRSVSSYRG